MQQDDILAQTVVKMILISQAVMTAAMKRNGTSEVLSGVCLNTSNDNSNNNNKNSSDNDNDNDNDKNKDNNDNDDGYDTDHNDNNNNNSTHNAFQLMMS